MAKNSNTLNLLLGKITYLALYSRLVLIFLQFLLNSITLDHQNDAFVSPFNELPKTSSDFVINFLIGGLSRWDAQHHLHNSIYGYVYESSLAFFPAFPILVKLLASILKRLLFFLNKASCHLISAVCLNVFFFVLAARTLFMLSYKKLKDENLSYLSCLLFCLNPASIFFSAAYTESFFSYITFLAMLYDDFWLGSFFVSLSTLIRSNGLTNIGFPVYYQLKIFSQQPKNLTSCILLLLKISVIIIHCLLFFILYQFYSYIQFCTKFSTNYDQEIIHSAKINLHILAGQGNSKMCNSTLPYFYVQNHYWNVGFLEYFKWKQIPNFVLAFPIISFAMINSLSYYCRNIHTTVTLGLKTCRNIFEHVVHLTFLILICLFFVHIQVTTRLLCSSSAAIYWFGAIALHSKGRRRMRLDFECLISNHILFYCVLYYILGTLLYSNNYPWT